MYARITYEMTRIRQRVACVASVSVWFQGKERLRNGIFGFGRPRNETRGLFRVVFDSRSSFFAPNIARKRLLRATQARQKVKLPCELYWKNKTYKLRRSVNDLNCEVGRETTVYAGVIFNLIILQQTKNCAWLFLWINMTSNLPTWFFSTSKNFRILESRFHYMRRWNSWCGA